MQRLGRERSARGDFAAVHACPDDSGAVPDTGEAKLVVLHPQHTHLRTNGDSAALRFARQCLETRGAAQRTNRNTVVFLAPDERRMEELSDAVRDLLAWRYVCERINELNLTAQQGAMAQRRRDGADDTVDLRIAGAYIWALVPDQPDPARPVTWQTLKAEGSQPRLADRVTAKLRQDALLTTRYGARNVRMDLDGALGPVWSPGTRRSATCGRTTAATLVCPEVARRQQGAGRPPEPADQTGDGAARSRSRRSRRPGPAAVRSLCRRPGRRPRRTCASSAPCSSTQSGTPGTSPASPRRCCSTWPRSRTRSCRVRVEISAVKAGGFPDDKVRIVTENARTLKFDQFGFEND